jgi:hypothetical protein
MRSILSPCRAAPFNASPQNIFAAAEPHFKTVDLNFGAIVAEAGQPVERVYFPHTGVISLVVEMTVGDMIETAMVGRDGVVPRRQCLPDTSDVLRKLANEFEPLRARDRSRCMGIRKDSVTGSPASQRGRANVSSPSI